jgi:hypothetical protein
MWKRVRFRGMDCVVFEGRPESKKAEYPGEYFYYPIRHSDRDWACPATIEKHVLVNHWGMIGTPRPLPLTDGYLTLTRRESERFVERR